MSCIVSMDFISNWFNLSITPKYAQTPTATAATMDNRFRIGIEIDVESLIFIIAVFIDLYQSLRSTSCIRQADCWFPVISVLSVRSSWPIIHSPCQLVRKAQDRYPL